MNCDEARAIRLRLTGQTPHTPSPAELRELAEPDAPSGTRARVAEPRSGADAGRGTSDAREAGRSAYSKPKVVRGLAGWFYHCHACCRGTCHGSQPAAFAAAVAHVREHHEPEPPADISELVGLGVWPKPPTVITIEPDVLNQLQAVLDQFRFPYYAIDEDGARTPRNYDRDDFTDDPAQVMWADAFNRAHNHPGARS